jgi:hypothetical protein
VSRASDNTFEVVHLALSMRSGSLGPAPPVTK